MDVIVLFVRFLGLGFFADCLGAGSIFTRDCRMDPFKSRRNSDAVRDAVKGRSITLGHFVVAKADAAVVDR